MLCKKSRVLRVGSAQHKDGVRKEHMKYRVMQAPAEEHYPHYYYYKSIVQILIHKMDLRTCPRRI